jgi:glycerol-3-phosphate dehydrogenase subunit B
MTARVIVIGAGIAGLAAAWSAARAQREVTLISAGPGATALGSGAVDETPWETLWRAARVLGAEPTAGPLAPEIASFVGDLGLWEIPPERSAWLATTAGRIRHARGRDRALLDLGPLAGRTVLLPRAERAAWDADAIAAALSADPVAQAKRIAFRAVDAAVLRFDEERRIGDGDLAARYDDEARRAWLADRLRAALTTNPDASAVLLGPWLGATKPQAEALSRLLGVAVGEALTGAGSPAGMRFEAARDALLDRLGVRRVRGRVAEVRRGSSRLEVIVSGDDAPRAADAVVLAVGGITGGGVIYAPPEHGSGADLAPRGRVPFELSLKAPVVLSLGGTGRMEIVASMHGPELDVTAWPGEGRPGALETVGVRCDGARAAERIFAAGDVIAGKPRTVLAAVAAGIAAGSAA